MIFLELDGELAAPGIDVGPAGRPALIQSRVDANDLPDRPLGRVGAGPFGEPHPQRRRGDAARGRCCRSPTPATFALNSTRPSIDSQRPSRVWTLFATATWVCRSGSPARLSR